MRGGIWVLNIFASVWCCAGIWMSGVSAWWMLLPISVSASLLWWAGRRVWPARSAEEERRVGRLVGIWSGVEGVAMFVAANVLINMHLPDAIMPAFAIIVGLHFLPLARGIPARVYYATGAALIVVGAIALIAPPFHAVLAIGCMAGLVLWLSTVWLVRHPG